MNKIIALILLAIGSGVAASAAVPEIDPASAGSAVTLLGAAILIYRGSRKR